MREIDFEGMARRLLRPRVFFLGIVLGFVACCITGRKAPALMPITDFERFHLYLNPEGLYFPTALQVRDLARRELPRDKIAVVIGGSSVMQGVGQHEHQVWTKRLQHELGDDYRILNLAMPGGAPNSHGQLAAEMLCRDGRQVIYVCDCFLHGFADAPDGNREIYRYFYHDARARNLLAPHAERDRAMVEVARERSVDDRYAELALQARANRWLSFNDLWHAVGYEYAFTTWVKRANPAPFQPRRRWADPRINVAKFRQQDTHGLTAVRDACRPVGQEYWDRLHHIVQASVPDKLRPKYLAVVNRFNPDYVRAVEADMPGARDQYAIRLRQMVDHLQANGLNAVEGCVTLRGADYMDFDHLLASGGNKLALELAPVIRKMAVDLRYRAEEDDGSIRVSAAR